MGILDTFLKNPQMIGDVTRFATENPQIAKAALSLFSSKEGSVGGTRGLDGILGSLKSGGLGDVVSSWLGNGANKAISPSQLESALDADTLSQFARKAGVSKSEASAVLAGILPGIVDKLSPDNRMPDAGALEGVIGKLMGRVAA